MDRHDTTWRDGVGGIDNLTRHNMSPTVPVAVKGPQGVDTPQSQILPAEGELVLDGVDVLGNSDVVADLATTLLVARAAGRAAYDLLVGYADQERRCVTELRRLGAAVPAADEPLEPLEGLLVAPPLVAQRFHRVSRELRLVTADSSDQPGQRDAG